MRRIRQRIGAEDKHKVKAHIFPLDCAQAGNLCGALDTQDADGDIVADVQINRGGKFLIQRDEGFARII